MKTEQIILALAVAREGSISKAADGLFISQPTASNMLKALETELGFRLFERARTGIRLTDAGNEFIKNATVIERSLREIGQIRWSLRRMQFRVVAIKLDFSELAFEKMCRKYISESSVGFSYGSIATVEDAFRTLENGRCDVAVAVCRKAAYESVLHMASRNHIKTIEIGGTLLELTCRKGHPILRDGKAVFDDLGEYTCFTSVPVSAPELYVPHFLAEFGDVIKNSISMDPSPVRYRLLYDTNGYLVSMPLSPEVKETYGLDSVSIENSDMQLLALYSENSNCEEQILEYVNICRELAFPR